MPLALTDKVLIRLNATRNVESYSDIDPNHSKIGCAGCHGGFSQVDATDDTSAYRAAHKGMLRDPSAIGEDGCTGCHDDIVDRNQYSIHSNLWGEKAHVALRNGVDSFEACPADIQDGFTSDCSGCHTTCGQCHVSRPHAAGGGFLEQRVGYSHQFIGTPSEENVCTACHGSRIGDDWNANQERVPGNAKDVHNDYGYSCLDCHEEDLHGEGPSDANYTSRYQVADLPKCIDCHNVDSDDNIYHVQHWPNANRADGSDLSCFACHSQKYSNCNTCHAGEWKEEYNTDTNSVGGYRVYAQFKLGQNPYYGDVDHPHTNSEWVAVRHVPVSPDAFEPWGFPTMTNYDGMETWKYTSPHNIQRWTDRTTVTEADSALWVNSSYALNGTNGYCFIKCHYNKGSGSHATVNADLYVKQSDFEVDMVGDDLSGEINANLKVLVDESFDCGACH